MEAKKIYPASPSKVKVLIVLGLLPFIVMHNFSALFFRMRGVPQDELALSITGFFLGLTVSALALSILERKRIEDRAIGTVWRMGVLIILLFPAFSSLLLPFILAEPHIGSPTVNFFQPFLWALLLPVGFRLFFHPALAGVHCILFGIIMAVGHLCWAFLLPVLSNTQISAPTLAFLNIGRCFFGIAFAIIAWHLLVSPKIDEDIADRKGILLRQAKAYKVRAATLWSFFLPLCVCFLLSSVLGHRLFDVSFGHEAGVEYFHLVMALFFLFIGFVITSKGENFFKILIIVALLCFSTSALLLYFSPSSVLYKVVNFLYFSGYYTLLFAGFLVCGLFVVYNSRSSLIIPAVLFASSASIPGEFFGRYVSSNLFLSPALFACIWLLVCLVSIPIMCQIFPLPAPLAQALSLKTANADESNQEYTVERIHNFTKGYKLKNRETQIMQMLLQGLSTSEMAKATNLKENTVRTYAQSLLKKTGTNSRLGLVAALARKEERVEL